MKKKNKERKFNRKRDQRRALRKSLAVALITHGRIKTTLAKAKELRPFIEKLITKAKKQDVAAMRYLLRFLTKRTAQKLIKDIAARMKDRQGGYTRIIKLSPRRSDNAKLAFIEFISYHQNTKHEKRTKAK